MKTNHSRNFVARQDTKYPHLRAGFKKVNNRAIRSKTRDALNRAFANGGADFDGLILPSRRIHGEDTWNWD